MHNPANRLTPCPPSPNCVSSLSKDRKHAIDPLRYSGSRDDAAKKLLGILEKQKAAHVTIAEPGYFHAEFRSRIFRFVDDVEFLFSDENKTIHVKSASRRGYSDLGANRRRVERLRRAFEGGL
jgi:uncharacterized protein (DUF1499 family)